VAGEDGVRQYSPSFRNDVKQVGFEVMS
jgi:hypothetical protein